MDLLIVPAFMWTRILNKYAWLLKLRCGHGQVHQTSHNKSIHPADINADICMGMYANIYIDTSADKDMNFFPYVDMTWKFHVRLNLLHREHRHEPLHEYLYLPG
jgi:hypothetical protein